MAEVQTGHIRGGRRECLMGVVMGEEAGSGLGEPVSLERGSLDSLLGPRKNIEGFEIGQYSTWCGFKESSGFLCGLLRSDWSEVGQGSLGVDW